jgi:hypothetical protein
LEIRGAAGQVGALLLVSSDARNKQSEARISSQEKRRRLEHRIIQTVQQQRELLLAELRAASALATNCMRTDLLGLVLLQRAQGLVTKYDQLRCGRQLWR